MASQSLTKLQKYAYDYLKDMILSGKLIDNEIYSETKIAKEIGISRTPMRDALRHLSQEGFIDILPSKGFILHRLTEKDIMEILQIRCAIEGYATYLLTKQNKTEHGIKTINKLRNILKKQEDIISTSRNLVEFTEYDTLFHTTIVSFAENYAFNEMFDNYMYRIKKLAMDSLSHDGRLEETMKEHFNIFNCICEGNIEDMYNITLYHMESPKQLNLKDYYKNDL